TRGPGGIERVGFPQPPWPAAGAARGCADAPPFQLPCVYRSNHRRESSSKSRVTFALDTNRIAKVRFVPLARRRDVSAAESFAPPFVMRSPTKGPRGNPSRTSRHDLAAVDLL